MKDPGWMSSNTEKKTRGENMKEVSKLSAIPCGLLGALLLANPVGMHAQPQLAPSTNTQSSPPTGASTPAITQPSYPQTADGLGAQLAAALEAYKKGDAAEARARLEQFRLPHSADWFVDHFGAEQGQALDKRYDQLFQNYLNARGEVLQKLASAKNPKITTRLEPATQQPLPIPVQAQGVPLRKPSGLVPLKDPACLDGSFWIKLTGKADLLIKGEFKAETWEEVFIYQDGAFRFLGHGAWPFWAWDVSPGEKPPAAPSVP
jgi:hypothetical protein